jgi:hypothetical protein
MVHSLRRFCPCRQVQGYVLLACQAHWPSLQPPPCDMINHPNECTPVSGRNLSLLTLGLYLIPVGEGSLRSCAAALGGDQFDGDDPAELHGKISFFNWYEICISLGGFLGLVALVWVQENKGWDLGFTLAAIIGARRRRRRRHRLAAASSSACSASGRGWGACSSRWSTTPPRAAAAAEATAGGPTGPA